MSLIKVSPTDVKSQDIATHVNGHCEQCRLSKLMASFKASTQLLNRLLTWFNIKIGYLGSCIIVVLLILNLSVYYPCLVQSGSSINFLFQHSIQSGVVFTMTLSWFVKFWCYLFFILSSCLEYELCGLIKHLLTFLIISMHKPIEYMS